MIRCLPDQPLCRQTMGQIGHKGPAIVAGQEPNFARFLSHTTNAAKDDDLDDCRPEDLEALWREAYVRLGKRGAETTHQIHTGEGAGGHQIIDIFSANMPFIVDSVLATIRAHGGAIRFLTHPILPDSPGVSRIR